MCKEEWYVMGASKKVKRSGLNGVGSKHASKEDWVEFRGWEQVKK